MSGMSLHIDLRQLATLHRRIDRLAGLDDGELRPLLEEIGEAVSSQTRQRFDDQAAPDGTPWATSKRAIEDAGQTLVDKAILKNTINYQVEGGKVKVGSPQEYAAIHQHGSGEEPVQVPAHQRRITQAFGRKLRFPVWVDVGAYSMLQNIEARPYLGLSTDDENEVEQIVDDFMREVLR